MMEETAKTNIMYHTVLSNVPSFLLRDKLSIQLAQRTELKKCHNNVTLFTRENVLSWYAKSGRWQSVGTQNVQTTLSIISSVLCGNYTIGSLAISYKLRSLFAPLSFLLLAIVLSIHLWFTDSDYSLISSNSSYIYTISRCSWTVATYKWKVHNGKSEITSLVVKCSSSVLTDNF